MPKSMLFEAIRLMKRIPRSGWIHAGVSLGDVESVADHSFAVTFLSMMMTDEMHVKGVEIDVARTLKMGILHDLSESLTFDISKRYLDFIGERGQRIKRELEDAANIRLLTEFSPTMREEAAALLRELKVGKTIEARVVAAADRIDLLMQLDGYRNIGYRGRILSEMKRKVTDEVNGMKNPIFSSMLRKIRE